MEIRSLANISFDVIFGAFDRAFSDYAVAFDRYELQSMLKRRGFVPELSFAAFDDGNIVSFTLNGIGYFNNKLTAYDTGTGTVKEYRGQGLVQKIFASALPYLKDAGVEQYLLEVLQDNEPAIAVYRKQGLEIKRSFNCFRQKIEAIHFPQPKGEFDLKPVTVEEALADYCNFEFAPSWQNSRESLLRAGNDLLGFGAFEADKCIGSVVFDPQMGDISALFVNPDFRRRGIASALLQLALQKMRIDAIKVLNVSSENASLPSFLAARNILPAASQYEMLLDFNCSALN